MVTVVTAVHVAALFLLQNTGIITLQVTPNPTEQVTAINTVQVIIKSLTGSHQLLPVWSLLNTCTTCGTRTPVRSSYNLQG